MTVIFVSHSIEDVAVVDEKIIVMNKGKVAMTGTVAEIFSRGNELKSMGLSVPQITEITDRLKEKGIILPPHIYTLKYGINAIAHSLGKGGEADV